MKLESLLAGVEAVAFDLDGTLLDTLPDLADAGNAMLASVGRAPVSEPVVRGYIGDGIARLVKRLLTRSPDGEPDPAQFEQAEAAFQAHYFANMNRRTRGFPGANEALALLHGHGLPLACVTNKAARFTRPLLDAHGLSSWFGLVVAGDSLAVKKPDPAVLLHCCEVFGIRPSALLLVGDSAVDVAAARAAGSPVVCMPYGYTGEQDVRDLGADAIVPGLLELARAIVSVRSLRA